MKTRIISLMSFMLILSMMLCLVPFAVSAAAEKHTVTFAITKLDGKLIELSMASYEVKNAKGEKFTPETDKYGWELNYFLLPDGDYTYRIEYNQSERAEGTFTVAGSDLTVQDSTETIYYPITFQVQPGNADVKLYKSRYSGAYGDPIAPDENGVYHIPFGFYRYIVSAEGYVTVNKSFNATDTTLKRNNYVITVKLNSIYEQLLEDVYDALEDEAGEPVILNEYSGNLYEYGDEFIPWAINSDYDDINVLDYVYDIISDEEYDGVELSIVDVYKDVYYYYDTDDESTDCSIIGLDGVIHYDAVNEDNITEDYDYGIGAYYIVEFSISYRNVKYDDHAVFTFVVPEHIKSRAERLREAADYAVSGIPTKTESDIVLPRLVEDATWSEYFIDSKWESSNEDVISSDGTVTLPAKDTKVTLTMTAHYIDWYIEDAGYMLDPGPFGKDEVRTVEILVPGADFYVTVENSYAAASGEGTHRKGMPVTVSAGVREGYKFLYWNVDGVELDSVTTSQVTFIMPANDVKLDAVWRKNEKPAAGNSEGKDNDNQPVDGGKPIVFSDIAKTDSFYEDVMYCYENGIMLGTSDVEFSPYSSMTRAMIVTVLWRLEGSPVVVANAVFTDTDNNTWYSAAVHWAVNNGIVLGYGDGKFGPEDSITREQLAVIIARYMRYCGYDMETAEKTTYDDMGMISDWAVDDVTALTLLGITEAEQENRFAPQSNALRHQIASVLHNLCVVFDR